MQPACVQTSRTAAPASEQAIADLETEADYPGLHTLGAEHIGALTGVVAVPAEEAKGAI
jgi:hypothetical protein